VVDVYYIRAVMDMGGKHGEGERRMNDGPTTFSEE
jgi:hypothetical protein